MNSNFQTSLKQVSELRRLSEVAAQRLNKWEDSLRGSVRRNLNQ